MRRSLWVGALLGLWGCGEVSQQAAHSPLAEPGWWWLEAAGNSVVLVLSTSLLAAVLAIPLGVLQTMRQRLGHTGLSRAVVFFAMVPTILWVGILRLWDPSHGVLAMAGALFVHRGLEGAQVVAQSVGSCLQADRWGADRAMGVNVPHRLFRWALPQMAPALGATVFEGAAASTLTEACLTVLGVGFPSTIPTLGAGLLPEASSSVFGASVISLAVGWVVLRLVPMRWASRRRRER